MHTHELQIELDNLMWNWKELEDCLQMAVKECRMMETMLAEVEDEQDEAIIKIEMLERESISKTELLDFTRAAFEGTGASHAVTPGVVSINLDMHEVVELQRTVAVLKSLFSAVLSFVVGMVIWEAEDPFSYPTLPRIAHMLTPMALSFSKWTVSWIGFTS
ncbi:hypothetical protein Acr_25g0010630 [Actinidia rufa]|uniref:Uncharacterized protein n=1 Tax=Actinidia rufa TaxID=165716 RepID=A0A7J0H1M0_9ERIC|nr:hypothetical protein Acr_25g0010630 [Actinidia rufa]